MLCIKEIEKGRRKGISPELFMWNKNSRTILIQTEGAILQRDKKDIFTVNIFCRNVRKKEKIHVDIAFPTFK